MKIPDSAQGRLWPRAAQHHRAHQPRQHLGQMKLVVEAVLGFGRITPRVLALFEGVAVSADGAFDVGQHHVDPARSALRTPHGHPR